MATSRFPFRTLLEQNRASPTGIPFTADFILAHPWREVIDATLIDPVWSDVFGDEWIPWETADRRAKFPEAYQQLAPYLAHYEE